MDKPTGKGWSTAYNVMAVLMGLMMCVSASGKFMRIEGAVKSIHEVVGVPLGLFPVLGALLLAGGLGLVAGIFRPKLGVAAAGGLVLYFLGAITAHVVVGDFAGLKAPIVPFLLACTVLALRVVSLRRSEASTVPAGLNDRPA